MSTETYKKEVAAAKDALKTAFGVQPADVAVILGSGFSSFTGSLEKPTRLSYSEIPNFPRPTVAGHSGECVLGHVSEKRVLIFSGRFHFYEGHPLSTVTLPVRAAAAWGVKTLVVTNAAGSLQKKYSPGSLALIRDHLNLMGDNPLRGENIEEFGPRFLDMTEAYDVEYRELAHEIGRSLRIPLPEVVYAALPGPSYETPAEIQMLSQLGAELVGMSTVPEVIIACHHGMRVLGISCITNFAAGLLGRGAPPLSHKEVLENAAQVQEQFAQLMKEWIRSAF